MQVREALALVKRRQATVQSEAAQGGGASEASLASAPPAAAEEEAGAGADPESGGEDDASEASGVQRRQSSRVAGAKRGRGPPTAELAASAGEATGDSSVPAPSVADVRAGLPATLPVRKRVKGRGRRARQVAIVYEQLASSLAADLVGREAHGGAAEAAAEAPSGGGSCGSQADKSVVALRLLTDRSRAQRRRAAVASLGSVAASAPGPASFAAAPPSDVGGGGGGGPFVVPGWGAGFDAGRPAPAIVEAANRDFLAPSAGQSRMPLSQGGAGAAAAAPLPGAQGDEVETFSDSDGDDKSGLLLPKPEAEKRAALWQSLHGKYVLQRATAREETARKRSEAAAAASGAAAAAEPTQQDSLGGDANEVSSVADGDLADGGGDGWAAGRHAELEDDDALSVVEAAPPPPENRHFEARKGLQKVGQGAGASTDVPLSRSRVLAAVSASAAAASAAAPAAAASSAAPAVLGAASSGRRTGGARLLVPLQFIPAAAPPPAPVAPVAAVASVRDDGDPAAKRSIRLPGGARAPIALPRGAAAALPAVAAPPEFADGDEYADEFVAEAAGTGARDDYEMDVDNAEY